MRQLLPCESCRRHVWSGEPCPFCGGAPAAAAPAAAARPIGRLGRAAILAFGATLGAGALASGCAPVALYGAPAPLDAGTDAGEVAPDAGSEPSPVAPAYGTPAPGDD